MRARCSAEAWPPEAAKQVRRLAVMEAGPPQVEAEPLALAERQIVKPRLGRSQELYWRA
jgi:hypothetical protein